MLEVVDFLSIGTNDLTQYTMAADRMATDLAHLTDPWQPAVLQLIAITAEAGRQAGKPVGVCGEAAADPLLACALVGMGITSLSMAAAAVRPVGARLASVDHATRARTPPRPRSPPPTRWPRRGGRARRCCSAADPASQALSQASTAQHPAVVVVGDRQVELGEDAVGVLGDGLLGDERARAAIAALERPSAISASTSRSRGVSRSSGSSRWRAMIAATTSGSSTVPPAATRRTPSTNSATSATRSLSR